MGLFYIPTNLVLNEILELPFDEAKHLKVLRKYDEILLTNGLGVIYSAKVISTSKSTSIIQINKIHNRNTENKFSSTLFFGLIDDKSRIEFIIEKMTELGVNSIYPVYCSNSQFKKFDRQRAIKKAISAIKQSERSVLPEINEIITFEEMNNMLKTFDLNILADKGGYGDINFELNSKKISLLIGPEGGFSKIELDMLADKVVKLKLANSILRAETAAISLLSKLT
jgi:16S rRNA (uracil1498-N3)-methyltransferase